ncbi:MAG: hypothetical protein ACOCWQ_01335, partial [Nanoarchaeota archaeon]
MNGSKKMIRWVVVCLLVVAIISTSVFAGAGKQWEGEEADFSNVKNQNPLFIVQEESNGGTEGGTISPTSHTKSYAFLSTENGKGKFVLITDEGYEVYGKEMSIQEVREKLLKGGLGSGWTTPEEGHRYDVRDYRIVFPDGRSSDTINKRQLKVDDTRKYLNSVLGITEEKYRIEDNGRRHDTDANNGFIDAKATLITQVEVPAFKGGERGLYDIGATYRTEDGTQYTVQKDGRLQNQITQKVIDPAVGASRKSKETEKKA